MLNSSQTHLPTTCAWLQISGMSVFNRSRSASVFDLLASFAFTVTLFLPSTWYEQVASGLVTLTGSADGALFSSESRAAGWRRKMASPCKREAGGQLSSGSKMVVADRSASV